MPCLWLLEMRRVDIRRTNYYTNSNSTNPAALDQVMIRMGNDELYPSQVLPYEDILKKVGRSHYSCLDKFST